MRMNGHNIDDLYDESGYRIRAMKSLIVQLREDHKDLNRKWKKFKEGVIAEEKGKDKSKEEEILRILSWVKEGLRVLEELRKRGIEGVIWGEIEDIEKDIKDKEMIIKMIPLSVSKETEYSHLR
jgi:hypothetical protein